MRIGFYSPLLFIWVASAIAVGAETCYRVRCSEVEDESLSLMLARIAAAPGIFMLGEQTGHFFQHALTHQPRPELRTCRSTWVALAFILNFIDPDGRCPVPGIVQRYWEWFMDLHRDRGNYNRCPATEDELLEDERFKEQSLPNDLIDKPRDKHRGSDGSECGYDENGNLDPEEGSFNYCPDPFSACHFYYDVMPDVLGG